MSFKINKNMQKPSSFDEPLADGLYPATIELAEYKESNAGNWMLSIRFKVKKNGKFVFDQIMDNPENSLSAYKLSRLLTALNINVPGEITLKDVVKVLKKDKPLVISVVTKEGSSFTNIDINKYDGYYPADYLEQASVTEVVAKSEPVTTDEPVLDLADDDPMF